MCADGAKAPAQRFAYANAIQGIIRVAHEEGPCAFFKGLGPNVVRSVLMSESPASDPLNSSSSRLSRSAVNIKNRCHRTKPLSLCEPVVNE
jgi:hypothetical protein